MEATLAGALRREKLSESAVQKLEAELEQTNCLVPLFLNHLTYEEVFYDNKLLWVYFVR